MAKLEKSYERFQQELDVNTLIKRLRKIEEFSRIYRVEEANKFTRIDPCVVIISSDSENEEQNFDFEVTKGYFYSSDENDDQSQQNSRGDEVKSF